MKPVLFFLSGSLKGQTLTPGSGPMILGSDPDCDIEIPTSEKHSVAARHAILEGDGEGFTIEGLDGNEILVNEYPVQKTTLNTNDLLRLGKRGPLVRFRLHRDRRGTKTFGEIIEDSATMTRDIRSRSRRYTTFAREVMIEAVSNSTKRMKIVLAGMGVLILLLAFMIVQLMFETGTDREESKRRDEDSASRIDRLKQDNEDMARTIEAERNRNAALQTALVELEKKAAESRKGFEVMSAQLNRVGTDILDLTRRTDAARRVYSESSGGVCYIELGISFFDEKSGCFVRETETDGLRVGRQGEKHVLWVSGSGFLVDDKGHVITNRHVTDPWNEDEAPGKRLLAAGLKPHRERFFACFPGHEAPMDLIRVAAHKDADVAILKLASPRSDLPLCQLAPSDHPTKSGDKTIVVGYPRGWKGLFPKLDQKAFDALVKEAPSNDGEMVEALAKVNGIRPHMTEGVLSTITSEQLIYDASTSQGGSGGPIFSDSGQVVGINTAMTQGFASANIGVRIHFARKLMDSDPLMDQTFDAREISMAKIDKIRAKLKSEAEEDPKKDNSPTP